MKCPYCKANSVYLYDDAVVSYKLDDSGKPAQTPEVHEMCNSWLECVECGKSSSRDGDDPERLIYKLEAVVWPQTEHP